MSRLHAAWTAFASRLAVLAGWRADLAATLLGLLSAAALPPVHAIPVLLVAVPGLLVLIGAARGPLMAARRGWWFGWGAGLLGLYWITEAILVRAAEFWWLVPIAVPGLAAVLAVFVAIPAAIAWFAAPGWPRVLALAGGWTLADLARQFVLTGFPWNPWGSVWAMPGLAGDVMIQPAALASVHGLTLATLLAASFPMLGRRGRAGIAALLVAWAGYGAFRLAADPPRETGLQVVLIQGDIAEGLKWNQALALRIFARYLALTHQAVGQLPPGSRAVVVWPETASPFLLQTDKTAREEVARAADGAVALVGAVRFDRANHPRNSLFAVEPDASVAALYDKHHLVPFGEYVPSWLPLAFAVDKIGGFAPGAGPSTMSVPGIPPAGALICYEAIFPGQVVDQAARPEWLVNVTNDAWFGDSAGPRQHLAAARMRAVEEGLPLMRAANTGITAGFDANGRELGRIGLNQTGTLTVALPAPLGPTLFSRFGLWIPLGMALFALGLGVSRRRLHVRVADTSNR
ncbi:MAG: apolipoprotein N-acyltransferase [Proteobacteria bacterium]|nr:apolipoprotein N-acyltransferase [Pseudomonadota bacterium]